MSQLTEKYGLFCENSVKLGYNEFMALTNKKCSF